MPSLPTFDKVDLQTNSDDDNSLGYTEIMESLTNSDYEDSTDSEADSNAVGDHNSQPLKKTDQKPTPMPAKKDKGWPPKGKVLPKKSNKDAPPIFFHTWYYDKNGALKKRRNPSWKVTARKKFKGYFSSRGSKVRSTMSTPAVPTNKDESDY